VPVTRRERWSKTLRHRLARLGGVFFAALALIVAAPDQARAAKAYRVEEAMIPMRDGTRLFAVIVIPAKVHLAPILLTRTPFGASARLFKPDAQTAADLLGPFEQPFVDDGYIRVFQDVRGRGRSEGRYVVTRPVRGPLNPTGVDHATDAYDTINWLVKHLPDSNGRVGLLGWSYDGFTAAMALLEPHPALKAAVIIDPMIDGWMGDDWFHYGAFRQSTLDFIAAMSGRAAAFDVLHPDQTDDYAAFLKAGSASDMARAAGLQGEPFWRRLTDHPTYDVFWRGQAVDRLLARRRSATPTLWVGSLWDQEDSWGAIHGYQALEAHDRGNDRNFLVLGPWRHTGVTADGSQLGPLEFGADTAAFFRTNVLKPFLDQRLEIGAPAAKLPPVFAFLSGANCWERLDHWPTRSRHRRFYLGPDFSLTLQAPRQPAVDRYRADPAAPAPYMARPVRGDDPQRGRNWLVADQRFLQGRADLLQYSTTPLTAPLRVSGAPKVDLYAATTGSDADWVVKLIDAFPDSPELPPERRGYQLIISADIFRGRYQRGFDRARALRPRKVTHFGFTLPPANHQLQPGHRLIVQVQSSWFPLYDRNPQRFTENIFRAKPRDYRPADQTLSRSPRAASSVSF